MTTLPTEYQQFIHLSRYSRWDYDKGRRETWEETVDRYLKFFHEHLQENYNYEFKDEDMADLRIAILELKIMPSMRCLMTAGPAVIRHRIEGMIFN